jgi:hypothetical protein
MNSEKTRLRGRQRNRWESEVRKDGRIAGGEGWQENIYNREEMKEHPENVKELSHSAHAIGIEWNNPSGRTMALGLTQSLTEMSTRSISWGVKVAGA